MKYQAIQQKKVRKLTAIQENVGNMAGGNSVTNFMGEMPNPTENPIPTSQPNPTSSDKPNWGDICNDVFQIGLQIYLNSLNNRQNNIVNTYRMPTYTLANGNATNTTYQNYEFSKFDVKKTEENIINSMKDTENILKQKIITKEDISKINNQTQMVMHNLFDDVEDLSVQKSNLSEIPTVESSEEAQKIENDRKQIRENAYQTILMLYQQRNVVEKQWKKVSTKDAGYDSTLNQYIEKKQEIEKLCDTVKDLFDYASKIDDTTLEKVKKLRDELGLMRLRPINTEEKEEKPESQKWIWPCKGPITSGYGRRKAPVPGASEFHNGWDIGVSEGTPIKAIAGGKIIAVGKARGYGNWVVIDHGIINGVNVTSEYGHISFWNVKYGQIVKQGDIIAKSGNSGRSSGAHLHITIREGKFPGTAVNPKKYIKIYF